MKAKQELNKKSSDTKALIEELISRWYLSDDDCPRPIHSHSEINFSRTINPLAQGLLAQKVFLKRQRKIPIVDLNQVF